MSVNRPKGYEHTSKAMELQKPCPHCEGTDNLFFGGIDTDGQIVFVCKDVLDLRLDLADYGVTIDDELYLPMDWRKPYASA
jgi:hypothetical protein